MIIRPSYTVLSGAAIGLVAGAAVYGAVSSSADQSPAKATVAAVPASAASCPLGLKLEDGVCVVHVVKTVVVPDAAAEHGASSPQGSVAASGTSAGSGSSASGHDATKAAEPEADDATEAAHEAADDSAVGGAPSDTSSSTPRD